MSEIEVGTWNVLHRIHAENWNELDNLSVTDEKLRNARIAERLMAALDAGCLAIGLQEVSGDQLIALRRKGLAGERFKYPRVPHLHQKNVPSPLARPREYLVVVSREAIAPLHSEAFASDPGKGFLAVRLVERGWVFITAHVSFGEKAAAQLAQVAAFVRAQTAPVALVGDFNAPEAELAAALGDGFVFATPSPGLVTRPRRDASKKSRNIDHAIVFNGSPVAARVHDAGGLSDHNLLIAHLAHSPHI